MIERHIETLTEAVDAIENLRAMVMFGVDEDIHYCYRLDNLLGGMRVMLEEIKGETNATT